MQRRLNLELEVQQTHMGVIGWIYLWPYSVSKFYRKGPGLKREDLHHITFNKSSKIKILNKYIYNK